MTPERNDRIDPVEAFLSGMSSGGLRLLIGMMAVIAACVLAAMANTREGGWAFPFDLMYMIFAWAEQGAWFVVGLAALLGGLFMVYRFGLDEGGKGAWLSIFLAFTVYLLPKNFTREEWAGSSMSLMQMLDEMPELEVVVTRDWIAHLVLVSAFIMIFWFGPRLLRAMIDRLIPEKEGD